MRHFQKPRIVVSECLEFGAVRYDGSKINAPIVRNLKGMVEFITVCPEVAIGMGVPRKPIRIVQIDGENRLYQPATDSDITEKMMAFTNEFLDQLDDIDGFILKSRSPTSGFRDVKVYPGRGSKGTPKKTGGFFGGTACKRFPDLAIEDEGRLNNYLIREHFLTKVFALADLRMVEATGKLSELIQFHSDYKFLLMAYNQKELRILGKITANNEKKPFANLIHDYRKHFSAALARSVSFRSNVNVVMHALGYFKKHLSTEEKAYLLDSLESYREEKLPLSAILSILRAWIIRFDVEYLKRQRYFLPFPENLIEITDSGKGRKL